MPNVLRIFKYLSNKFKKVKTTDKSGKEIYLNMNNMRDKISTCLNKIENELDKGKNGNEVYKNLKQISDYLEQILKARDRNWGKPEAEPKYPGLEKLKWALDSQLTATKNCLINTINNALCVLSQDANVGIGSFWEKSLRKKCSDLHSVVDKIVNNGTESNDFYLLNGEIIPTEKEKAMGINPNKETNFYDYLKNGKFPTIEMALDSLREEANKGGKKFDYLCLPESKEKVTRVLYGVVDSSGFKEPIANEKGKLYVVPVQDPKLMQDVTSYLEKQKQDYMNMGVNLEKETNLYGFLENSRFPTIEKALNFLLKKSNKDGKNFDYLCLSESRGNAPCVLCGVVDSSRYKESIVNEKGKLYVVPVQDPKLMQDVTLALRKQKQDYDEKNKIEYMKTKEMDEIFNEIHVNKNKKKKKPKEKLFTLDSSEKNKDTELMVGRVTQLDEIIDTAQKQLIDLRKSSTMVNLNNNEIKNLNKKLSNTAEQVDNASKQLAEINTCLSQEKSLSPENKEILGSKVELVSNKLQEVITQKDEIKKLVNEAKSEIIMNDINANHKKIQIDELIFTYNNNKRNSKKPHVVDLEILLSKLDSDLIKAIEKFVEEQMKLVSNLKSCHFVKVGTDNDLHYYQLQWNTDTICKFQGTIVGVQPTVNKMQRDDLQKAINNVLESMNKENNEEVNELNRKIESLNQKNEKLEQLSNLINSSKKKDNIKNKLSGTNDEIITIRTDLKQLVKRYCTSRKLYTIANKLDTLESKIKVNEDTITKLISKEVTPERKMYTLSGSKLVETEDIENPYKNSSNTDRDSTCTPLPDLSNETETNNELGENIYMDNKTQTDINFEVNKNKTSEKSASNTRTNTNQKDNMNTQDTKNSSVTSDTKQTDESEKQKVEKGTQTVMSEKAWIDAIIKSVEENAKNARSFKIRGQGKTSYWYADQLLFGLCISLSKLKNNDPLISYVREANQADLSKTIVKLFQTIFGSFYKSYAYYTSYHGEDYTKKYPGYEDKLIDYDYSTDWNGGTIKNVDNIATALQTAANQLTSEGFLKSLQDSGILNSTGTDVGDNYKSTDYKVS